MALPLDPLSAHFKEPFALHQNIDCSFNRMDDVITHAHPGVNVTLKTA
jgi:hypothetical protein